MDDRPTTKTTVRVTDEFEDDLLERYPSATSLPQALLAAAQDGVDFRQAIEGDLEGFVRNTVSDELRSEERGPRVRTTD